MTSTITVKAHCVSSKEVHIIISDPHNPQPKKVLQDSEVTEVVVFDDRSVLIREVVKGDTSYE